MQVTSAEYKEEQLRDLRNASHVYVYLGVISKEAQANAYVATTMEDYASGDIFVDTSFEAYYASLEQNYTKVDGTHRFLPSDSSQYALFQGAVTTDIEGSITFDFEIYHALDIKGLTIDFGEYYPTAFTVTNGTDTFSYTNNAPGVYVLEDVFEDSDYITITPTTMVGGEQRMRIHSIIFGVGLIFDDKSLISTQRSNTVDHLSGSLPSKAFTFTVDNTNKKFNKDNPKSYLNFLQTEQACSYEYGRDMDDGTVYIIDGGNVALKTWSSNDTQAKFSCVGYMDFMEDSFYKGQFRPEGITAYALAEEVLEDAGIEDYRIDSYLKQITLYNPLPVSSHKNCLQMIANATQSIFYEDRNGRIIIESSFTPDITSITYESATNYSETETIITDDETINYATLESNYSKVDGSLYFLPSSVSNAEPVGYVSSAMANSGGVMSADATITIEWEAQWTFYGLSLTYLDWVKPTQVTIKGYADNVEVVSITTTDTSGVDNEFDEVDKIKIIFDKAQRNQRVHCKKIGIGDISNYSIKYHDMSDTPVATSMENIKNIEVHYYTFSESTEETSSVTTTQAVVGENLITFSSPYCDYSVAYKDEEAEGTLTIEEYGAYYVVVSADTAGQIEVTGRKIEMADNTYTYVASEMGGTKTVTNQLISSPELAAIEGKWVGDYYTSGTEYSINFRGEPALDCDDLIYLENKFVPKNLIRITSETLDTGTGMSVNSHKLKAVRVSYGGGE